MTDLAAALADDRSLRAQLIAQWPELAEDESALIDTLDGISNLDQQILLVMRASIEREAYADAIGGMMQTLAERKERLVRGAKTMRAAVLHCMQEAGRSRVYAPDMTIGVQAGRISCVVTDMEALPAQYVKVERTPRMKDINDAIKAGVDVPGTAPRNNPDYLVVRRS